MSARTVLVCNACGTSEALSPPRDTCTTRRTLRMKGWGYWKRGEDYCPKCLPGVRAAHNAAHKDGYA